MEKKTLQLSGMELAYAEKNAHASASIVFIHGNSVSSRTWRKQWNDPLFDEYRLLAIDLPAHGDSGVARDPAASYTLPALGRLMAEAVQRLTGGGTYLLAGVSLATNIIAEMLVFGISAAGLLLAGPCVVGEEAPLEKLILPGTHVSVVFTDEPAEAEVISYGQETSLSGAEDQALFLEDFNKVASPFRSALGNSIAQQQYSDQLALLREAGIPLLVLIGADEKVINPDYLDGVALPLWNNRLYKIPGASHLLQLDQSEAFNRLLADFAADLFKGDGA